MSLEYIKKILYKNQFLARLLRNKFDPVDFLPQERLYRGYRNSECDDTTGVIGANSIDFPLPDCSCYWSRFSKPNDVKRREGRQTDGCYSFTVQQSRYREKATPCHDPCPQEDTKNYAHTEVRQLLPEEDIYFEPPKGRRLQREIEGWSKSQRLEYRHHIALNLNIEIQPTD